MIAENVSLILPFHKELDKLREEIAGGKKIGTTGRGIGPAYEDKVGRRSVRLSDLNNPELLYKPGLTGFGQIKSPNSNRNLKIFDEYYSKNHSIIFDLEIILKTVFKL